MLTKQERWSNARDRVLSIYEHKCAMCAVPSLQKRLSIHHIKDRHVYPRLACKILNLIPLCGSCHKIRHMFIDGYQLTMFTYRGYISRWPELTWEYRTSRPKYDSLISKPSGASQCQ